MAGVRQHGWRAIPTVRSEYGADTLPDRYRSDGRCRSARTAVHHARRRDRYRRTRNFSFRDRLFHSDGTVADVLQYFPVNTWASKPGPAMPRSIGRDGAGASTMQSHFVQAFFTRSVRITFRALLTSSVSALSATS